MVYVIQVCWRLSSRIRKEMRSILILLESRQQTCMIYTIAVCTVKTPDDGQRNCPKHVEFHSKIKFWKIGASSWFYYKKVLSKTKRTICIFLTDNVK
jgi:hypothetical protein